jgi:hypothetical protein
MSQGEDERTMIGDSRTRRQIVQAGLGVLAALGVATLPADLEARNRKRRKRRSRQNGQGSEKSGDNGLAGQPGSPGSGDGGKNTLGADTSCTVCPGEGNCTFSTIQAAIDADDAQYSVITVCAGTYNETVTINKHLFLAASEALKVILEPPAGSGPAPAVIVQPQTNVTINGFVIQGGTGWPLGNGSSLGGGVMNFGNLTLQRSLVQKNQADQGGGICNYPNARLTLDNTTVAQNTAAAASGPQSNSRGGGIINSNGSQLTLQNKSVIELNNATRGGGIDNLGTLLVNSNSAIKQNTASAEGGGIYNEASHNVVIDASTVALNTAQTGGGIYNRDGSVTLRNRALIFENNAQTGAGIFITTDGFASTLALFASTITNNLATQNGGGIDNQGGTVSLDTRSQVRNNTPNNCVGTNACGA